MASRGNRDVHRSHTNFLYGPASHDGAVSFQPLRVALAQIGVVACITEYVFPSLGTLLRVDSVVRAEERDMLTIRKANCYDVFDAWEIRKTSVHAACAGYYPEATLSGWVDGTPTDKWASIVERDFYVAVDKGLIVGTGMLTVANGQVDAIFVRPSHMGGGIGRKMLKFIEALADDHGLVEMHLDATLNAAPFYRRCGWTGDSLSTYRTSRGLELACVPMTKRLPLSA